MADRLDTCRACGGQAIRVFDGQLLGKYRVNYFRCQNCGFLQTEKPFWLEEAYRESININDTGLVKRNLWLSSVTALMTFLFLSRKAKGLDYGGGYGLFVRLMRDKGFNFFWEDPLTKNLFARGFEYTPGDKADLVTCFEGFEHFEEPKKEVESMLERGKNILFSTRLLPEPPPTPNEWWYYDLENGQHIAFYTRETLSQLANQYGLHYSSAWSVHMFSEKKIPRLIFKTLVMAGRIGMDKLLFPFLKSKTVSDSVSVKKLVKRKALPDEEIGLK
jgi:hypothetical protein